MTPNDVDTALQAIADSLAAKLPDRVVGRDLVLDPSAVPDAELLAGKLVVLTPGGGEFEGYRGREATMRSLTVQVAGYVKVPEDQPAGAVELAELDLLADVLAWVQDPGAVHPRNGLYPKSWRQSQQLEHPYGWFVLEAQTRP